MHEPPRAPTGRSPDDPEPPTPDAGDGEPAPSPCIGVCRIVEQEGRCAGCLRTLAEIASWGGLDEPSRRALLGVLRERRAEAGPPVPEATAPAR